jgi:calnexin
MAPVASPLLTAATALTAVLIGRSSSLVAASTHKTLPVQNLDFYETFDEVGAFTSGRWVKSAVKKYRMQPIMVKPPAKAAPGFEEDKGLDLTQENKYYGVASKLPRVVAPKDGQDFVLQYESRFNLLSCGGAYIKLLRSPAAGGIADLSKLDADSPFSVMFGPDKCGLSNQVHFIMNYQDPVTKVWGEKRFNNTASAPTDKLSHLYTLYVNGEDNSFQIYIDKELEAEGNLLTDMVPPLFPPSEVDDPNDRKPADWVDSPTMPDPNARKPDSWDDSIPSAIRDPKARKPDGWREDLPAYIRDPNAEKPEEWDFDLDGMWEPPLIRNPACADLPGCGTYTVPYIPNPAYRGIWKPPQIPNPAYKGPWVPRKIPNPAYYDASHHPVHIAPISAVAVEVWTTDAGIHYDNIAIARSLKDAFAFADATFVPKQAAEAAVAAQELAVAKAALHRAHLEKEGWVGHIDIFVHEMLEKVKSNKRVHRIARKFATRFERILGPRGAKYVQDSAPEIAIALVGTFITMSFFGLVLAFAPTGIPPPSERDGYGGGLTDSDFLLLQQQQQQQQQGSVGTETDAAPARSAGTQPPAHSASSSRAQSTPQPSARVVSGYFSGGVEGDAAIEVVAAGAGGADADDELMPVSASSSLGVKRRARRAL